MVPSLNAAPKIKDKLELALMTFHERENLHVPTVQSCRHSLIAAQLRQELRRRSSCSSTKIHQRVFLRRELCWPASPVQKGENPWLWWKTARMAPAGLSKNDASTFLKDESIKHNFHLESFLPIPEKKSHSPVFIYIFLFSHPDTLFKHPLCKTFFLSFFFHLHFLLFGLLRWGRKEKKLGIFVA